jgi:drug/metabolite transporter (DMT)-like permease
MNWIATSILGAFFQNARSSVQKKLNSEMSLMASTYVRFSFALPIIFIVFYLYFGNYDYFLKVIQNNHFILYVILGSIFQITFTFLFLYLFKFTNFLIGTALSKTEVIQIAFFEFIILKDYLNLYAVLGIIISTFGVIIFSTKDLKNILKGFFSKSTIVGIFCGTLLALSIVFFRGSMQFIDFTDKNFDKALITLLAATFVQTTLITIYLLTFEIKQFQKIRSNVKLSFLAGLFGFSATVFWFYSFSLVQAAFVRTVGQIELLFSYISSRFMFKEKVRVIEIVGIFIFISGLILVIFNK